MKTRKKSDAESKPQVYSWSKSPLPQFWEHSLSIQVFHRCRVHQVDCGWGFNPLLLRLHREISLSLLCLHSSWVSALVLAPPLRVGHPQASAPRPDRRWLKQQLIRALLLTQAGEREGYGSNSWNAGRVRGSRGQHNIATA